VAHRFPAGLGRRPRPRRRSRSASCRGCAPCWARTPNSRSNGQASTRSSAAACSAFATAACSSPAMPHTSVSPFGARGANSGIQDADNLVWKLAPRAGRAARRTPARQLRFRARAGCRREHPQLDARDGFHHAEKPRVAHISAMRCSTSRRSTRSRAGSSTAAGFRYRRSSRILHSIRPTAIRIGAALPVP
jgi:hypothetical protein